MKMTEGMKSKQKLLVFSLILVLGVAANCLIRPVLADVPSVENIEPWISGTDTILNITVRHASPTGSHYVDRVEVDVDGSIENISLSPQTTVTFVVQYNMGEVIDTPTVSARAHCTFHGWSSWSEPIIIPEFSVIHLLLVLVLLSITILLFKSKFSPMRQRCLLHEER